ncbi:hypothetical protein DKX38_006275 [Salix brachista]|uniref:Uncharacterized protein n=1 Tax=Salix brachista TaxID=2182728 RepID=A0A5N5N2U4_9ROSI|nr:hypothetical protein DKX38_006275 [Salix brachista]
MHRSCLVRQQLAGFVKLEAIFVYYVFQWGISCQAEAVDNEEWGPGIHMVNINVHMGKIVRSTVLIQGRSATSFEPSTRLLNSITGPEAIGYRTMLFTYSICSYAARRHWNARRLCPLVVPFLCTSSANLLLDQIDFVRWNFIKLKDRKTSAKNCRPRFRLANRALEDPSI